MTDDAAPATTRPIDTRTPARRRIDAVHEAGHCVAAHVLGFPITRVHILLGDDEDGFRYGGRCYADQFGPARGLDGPVRNLALEHGARQWLVFLFAGPAAQRIYRPRSRVRQAAGKDHELVEQWVRLVTRSTEAARHLLRRADQEARDLVREHWRAVEAVAATLVDRSEMDGPTAVEVIKMAEAKHAEKMHARARAVRTV